MDVVLDQANNLNPDDIVQLLGTFVSAVQGGSWLIATAPLILGLIWALRKFVIPTFAVRFPFLVDKRFTLALALVGPIAAALGTALIAGTPITVSLVLSAILSGLAAVGLYSGQKNWAEGVAAAKLPQPSPSVASKMSAVIGDRPLK